MLLKRLIVLLRKIVIFLKNFGLNTELVKIPDYVETPRHTKIDKKEYNIKYNIDSLLANATENNHYLLTYDNMAIALDDILSLNDLFIFANNQCKEVPIIEINKEDLFFAENIVNGFTQYCFIEFRELTKKGNIAKYPYALHIHISQDRFGTIFYNKENEIGKVWFVIRTNFYTYELTFFFNKGAIDLTIYKTDIYIYNRTKIYSSKERKE